MIERFRRPGNLVSGRRRRRAVFTCTAEFKPGRCLGERTVLSWMACIATDTFLTLYTGRG
jgi:hypothetical protein